MTAPPDVSITELARQLTLAAQSPGGKDLFCARDVADALAQLLPQPWSPALPGSPFHATGVIAGLLAVNIIVTPDSPPGSFRLVWHYDQARRVMSCEVHGETVSHARCAVVLEGVLAGP